MKGITQTNRTILFEHFNGEQNDLMTILSDMSLTGNLYDEKIEEINKKLLVGNFEEFLEKFSPTLYGFFEIEKNEMKYTLNRPTFINPALIQEIPLNKKNDFMAMLFALLESKENKEQGKKYGKFQFEHILEFISPAKKAEHIVTLQKKLLKVFQVYMTMEECIQKRRMKMECDNILAELAEDYTYIMSFLPLAMEDLRNRLLPYTKEEWNMNPITVGILGMENEEVKILLAPQLPEVNTVKMKEEHVGILKEMIIDVYRQYSGTKNTYIENIILRSYGFRTEQDTDVEAMVNTYNQYLEFYTKGQENFLKVVKPLIEKILGVKLFFDQYNQTKNKIMGMKLLITNVKNEMWIQTGNLNRLEAYLNTVNTKINYDNTIWFSIFPSAVQSKYSSKKMSRQRFQGNEIKETTVETKDKESIIRLMEITSKFKIQNFYSFETKEMNTFGYVAKKGIDHFIKDSGLFLKTSFKKYIIPCYPNFSIIPKERSSILMGNRLYVTESNDVEEMKGKGQRAHIWMGGLYVEAAYVAVGLVAAYQCPGYLMEHFGEKHVAKKLPGVRYNLEQKQQALQTCTTLSKEITGFKKDVVEQVEHRSFGFMFSSELLFWNKKRIRQITVWKARNLLFLENRYECVFEVLTATYIKRILRYDTFDYKKDEIVKFFSNHPRNRKSMWMAEKSCVNAIIGEEDEISYAIDEKSGICTIQMQFQGESQSVEVKLDK